jgi:hypothetical protein
MSGEIADTAIDFFDARASIGSPALRGTGGPSQDFAGHLGLACLKLGLFVLLNDSRLAR